MSLTSCNSFALKRKGLKTWIFLSSPLGLKHTRGLSADVKDWQKVNNCYPSNKTRKRNGHWGTSVTHILQMINNIFHLFGIYRPATQYKLYSAGVHLHLLWMQWCVDIKFWWCCTTLHFLVVGIFYLPNAFTRPSILLYVFFIIILFVVSCFLYIQKLSDLFCYNLQAFNFSSKSWRKST